MPITETATWDSTIYQIQTTDAVIGGADSAISNKQAKGLADRTLYLKTQLEKQMLYSSAVIDLSFVATPSTTNLTLADAGKLFTISRPALTTVNLPDVSAIITTEPLSFSFINGNTVGDVLIVAPGGNSIIIYGASLRLRYLDGITVTIQSTGVYVISNFFQTSKAASAGDIKYTGCASAPYGWLACNGAAVSRTTYAELFSNIGVTFGVGDGTTTFNLPDLRGEFIRGLDSGRGVDTGRTLGSAQAEMIGPHSHTIAARISGSGGVGGNSFLGDSAAYNATLASFNNGGTENRPRNVALLAVIKY